MKISLKKWFCYRFLNLIVVLLLCNIASVYAQEASDILDHKVEKGETLYKLSILYSVPVDSIKKWNALQNETLQEGKTLHFFNIRHLNTYQLEANKLKYKVELLKADKQNVTNEFDTYFKSIEARKQAVDANSPLATQEYMVLSKEKKYIQDSLLTKQSKLDLQLKLLNADIAKFENASTDYINSKKPKLIAEELDAEEVVTEVPKVEEKVQAAEKEKSSEIKQEVKKERDSVEEKTSVKKVKSVETKTESTKQRESKEKTKDSTENKKSKTSENTNKQEPSSESEKTKTKKEKTVNKEKDSEEDIIIVEVETTEVEDTLSKKYVKQQQKLQKKLEEELDSSEMKGKFVVKEVPVTETKKKKYKIGDEVDATRREKAKFLLARAMHEIDKFNFKKAYEYTNKSIALNPSYTEAYLIKGDLYASMQYFDKAIGQYEHAIFLDNNNPQTYYNIGNCYMYLNKKDKAITNFTESINIDSTYIMAYMGRSSLLSEQKKHQEALNDYNKILKLNKYFYPALKGRGIAHTELGNYESAIRDFNELLEYEKDPSIYYLRGMAKMYKSMIYEACLDFLSASEQGYSEADKAIKKYCE